MSRITLWLFVIALGLDVGAGLYEARIVVPLWANGVPATLAAVNPFAQVAIDAGINFWKYLTSASGHGVQRWAPWPLVGQHRRLDLRAVHAGAVDRINTLIGN